MIGPEVSPVLVVSALAVPLIGALGLAIRRSTRRQECARLRDRLVDAARAGELDITDWRVFGLIDWFDQVASTGRTGVPGRHTPGRRDAPESLAHSLAATLLPLDPAGAGDPAWPQPPSAEAGDQVRAAAVRYRQRCQQRLWILPLPFSRRPASVHPRIAVTGAGKPAGALIPLTGPAAADPVPLDLRERAAWIEAVGVASWWGEVGRPVRIDLNGLRADPSPTVMPSLIEEIFAVAGPGR